MITNLVMAVLISAAGVSSSNLVYNVTMKDNRLINKEVYTLNENKYLKRFLKMDFTYNEQGLVTNKKTYVWNDVEEKYILQNTEIFNNNNK